MRHLPFFAELASLEDGDPRWRALSAGLVVLRLVDAWIDEGASAVTADGWGLRSVDAAIEEIPESEPARAVLSAVVQALRDSSTGDMHLIAPRLIAYGRALDHEARWLLAADVFQTVIAHVHPVEESDPASAAHMRLGFCQRNAGALDEAAESYAAASAIAADAGDMFGILRAQIGAAKIAIARGNMPRAEALLDDTISRSSTQEELSEVHATALQDRALVAHHRGRYDLAISLAYRSLALTKDQADRDRLLHDIAGAFYMLGVHSAARDAYLILEATAHEQYQRWAASINLMEIAARAGSMPLFERYRRSLAAAPLSPDQMAQYHLQAAESYEALTKFDAAVAAAKRAQATAEEYGFNQILFAAEALIERVETGLPQITPFTEAPIPPSLQEIATDISEKRKLVPS